MSRNVNMLLLKICFLVEKMNKKGNHHFFFFAAVAKKYCNGLLKMVPVFYTVICIIKGLVTHGVCIWLPKMKVYAFFQGYLCSFKNADFLW